MFDNKPQVRKRTTYRMWEQTSQFLDTNPSKKAIMVHMHGLLDGYSAYGSIQKADWSRESLDLVLEDEVVQEVTHGNEQNRRNTHPARQPLADPVR